MIFLSTFASSLIEKGIKNEHKQHTYRKPDANAPTGKGHVLLLLLLRQRR